MDAINSLRSEIDSYDWLARIYRDRINRLVDAVELQLYDNLVRAPEASEMLGVSERQIHNLAGDPKVGIWKYEEDGRRKTTNRRTKTFYRTSEIVNYKENGD